MIECAIQGSGRNGEKIVHGQRVLVDSEIVKSEYEVKMTHERWLTCSVVQCGGGGVGVDSA